MNLYVSKYNVQPCSNGKRSPQASHGQLIAKIDALLAETKAGKEDGRKWNLEDQWQAIIWGNFFDLFPQFVAVEQKIALRGEFSEQELDFLAVKQDGTLTTIEIKTHLTQVLAYDNGRKFFYPAASAASALFQIDNYVSAIKDNEKAINALFGTQYDVSPVFEGIQCLVIASSDDWLAGKNTKQFKGLKKAKLLNDYPRLNVLKAGLQFTTYSECLHNYKNMVKRFVPS